MGESLHHVTRQELSVCQALLRGVDAGPDEAPGERGCPGDGGRAHRAAAFADQPAAVRGGRAARRPGSHSHFVV